MQGGKKTYPNILPLHIILPELLSLGTVLKTETGKFISLYQESALNNFSLDLPPNR
jgi:hypothetical protein